METDCIFCRIVAHELPAERIYEDAQTLAFMDIGPLAKGHALVIPKAHFETVADAPPEALSALMPVIRKIVRAQFATMPLGGVNVTQANGAAAGQVVPHVHFHVIPRPAGSRSFMNWQPGQYESPGEMAAYAQQLRNAIDSQDNGAT